jgi:hypothetical protein
MVDGTTKDAAQAATTTSDEVAEEQKRAALKPLTQNDIRRLTDYFASGSGAVAGKVTQDYDPKGGGAPAVCACVGDCDCPVRLEEQEARIRFAREDDWFITMRRRLYGAGNAEAWTVLAAYFTPEARATVRSEGGRRELPAKTDWGEDMKTLRQPPAMKGRGGLGELAPLLGFSAIARAKADVLLLRERLVDVDRFARQPHLPPWRRTNPTPKDQVRELREWSPMYMVAKVLEYDAAFGVFDQEPTSVQIDAKAREVVIRACGKGAREKPGLARKKGSPDEALTLAIRIELKALYDRACDVYRREREARGDEEAKVKDKRRAEASAAREKLLESLIETKRAKRQGRTRKAVVDVAAALKTIMDDPDLEFERIA